MKIKRRREYESVREDEAYHACGTRGESDSLDTQSTQIVLLIPLSPFFLLFLLYSVFLHLYCIISSKSVFILFLLQTMTKMMEY